ncbi:LysR family transcriptional regulator [Klebsiella pneumoniae]|uniref:LysR family transcriptional regulator n=1 Tax=Klebsiella pneumoniae TaxID=573 RepID=A0A2X3I436_KLEPN|nr:LysR family transcriptional regulator [Klebsiella pneumoniae]
MLEAARQAMDSAGSRQTVAQGKLTLSVPKAVGRFVIHPLMMAFFHRYPQVDVCLRLEDRPLDFIDDGMIWRYASPIPPPPACMANR